MESKLFNINNPYLLEVYKDGMQYNFEVKIAISLDNVYKGSAVDLKSGLFIEWIELQEMQPLEEMKKIITEELNNL